MMIKSKKNKETKLKAKISRKKIFLIKFLKILKYQFKH